MRKINDFKVQKMRRQVKLYTAFLLLTVLLQTTVSYSQTGLITNVTTTTGHLYTVGNLITGTTAYSDRTYLITDVPAFINNAAFIKTPNDDKANKATSSPSFVLTQSATVYIAYDPRATATPAWLSGWQKLVNTLGINDPNISGLSLYSKAFPAGTVTLGGNLASPAAGALNMYLIIASAQNAQYNLTITTSGSGTVTENPNQVTYASGTSVTLTATPAAGQQFTGWSGDVSGTTNPLTILMDTSKSVTATFAPITTGFNLTVTANGNGTITKNPDQANYDSGTAVILTAIPGSGQQFTGWSGDASGTVIPLTIMMNANKTVTATFIPLPTQFSVTVTASGSGTVTKTPDQATYDGGTGITLTATPAAGQQFSGWSGDTSGTINPLSITVNGNKNITANFTPSPTALITNVKASTVHPYTLGTLISGTAVYSDRTYQSTTVPAFLNNAYQIKTANDDKSSQATSTLSFSLTQSATVYVAYDPRATALPAWLSTWQKLSSQVGINDPNIIGGFVLYSKTFPIGKVTLGGNLASPAVGALNNYFVMALAQVPQYNLTVTASGNGVVTKNPAQADYTAGTSVILTATPATGQLFTGWSGNATGAVNPLTVIMDTAESITATFAPVSAQYILTVTSNGSGTITKSPNQATYTIGTSVSLTATPAAGQQFTGWSGAATGTVNPFTIIMNSDKAVTATFAPILTQYNLTISTSGSGTVSKSPNQATYASGTSVSLTATPAAGQRFTGWSGDISDTANPVVVLMNANKSITATFAAVSTGPSIAAFPLSIYDNDVSGGAIGINRTVTVKNKGQGVLSLSSVNTSGTNTNQFVLSGLPALPVNINAGDSISFSIAFNPSSIGLKTASINITSNDSLNPSIAIPLRGLGTSGLGGANEPSLQAILNLLEIQVNVGDDNVSTDIINTNTTTQRSPILGDEISIQQFQKAGAGNVTITPLCVFGPTFVSPVLGFGWYKSGDISSQSELFSVSNSPVTNGQTVNVNFTGTLSFDPVSDTFGFYSRWPYFNNRHEFSEDNLNTFPGAVPHHVRVYRYKKNGIVVPNTYLVAFEEDTTRLDYNDLVFVVSNVKKYTAPAGVTILPLADAYVRNGTFGNTNFGSDTSLIVKSSSSAGATRYSYLKFSLADISNVRSAKVRLYGSNTDNTASVDATLFGLNDDSWTESGINLNNGPTPSSPPLSTTIVNNNADYYEFDVTDFVKTQLAGDKVVSVFVKDTTNKNATLTFNSKENGKNAPQLIIDTSTALSNALLFVENMDGYPSNDHVVFSHVHIPWTRDTVYNANHDSIKIRIHNNGINPLVISNLKISVDTLWKIDKLGGINYDPSTQLPATVISGGTLDLMVKFIANNVGHSNLREQLLHETLTITSNDDKTPDKKLYLDGLWQYSGEGPHEPYSQEVLTAFGYTTKTGFTNKDPDIGDSTKLKGDEIKPDYFLRADTTLPVSVRQIASYHGCCQLKEHFKWFDRGTKIYNDLFIQIGPDGQTLLPRKSLNGSPSAGTFTPAGVFGVLIGAGNSTVPALNTSKKLGVRVYKVFDGSGNIIPDTYIFGCDYLGVESNYDYNDNMYYVTNLKPYLGTVYYSPLNVTPSDLDFGEHVLQTTDSMLLNVSSGGKTYTNGSQDPPLVISSVVITGENASEFSADMPLSTTLNPQQATTIKVKFSPLSQGLKIADMLIYYNNSQSPRRVPLYGIAKAAGVTVTVNYRINSGASSPKTFNGKTWAADNQYSFDNLGPFTNNALKQIAGTDEDFLYVDEQSSNADKKPFRYQFPVPNGDYYVRLHFAEIYWGAPGQGLTGGVGSRVFSVKLENQYRLTNYDVTADVGGATAVIKNFPVTVTDSNLNIDFSATVNRPLVMAVEVYSFSSPSPKPAAIATTQNKPGSISINPTNESVYNADKPRVYPNPLFNKNLNIRFPAKYQGIYTIQLVDILGRKYDLGKTKLYGAGSTMKVNISMFSLKPGIYFLKISSGANKVDIVKLLIH